MVFCNDAGPMQSGTAHGELVLASSLGLTSGNTISGNTFQGISLYSPVALVDNTTSTLHNSWSGNLFEDFGALAMYDWGGIWGGDATFWRGVSGGTDLRIRTRAQSASSAVRR